MCGLTMKHSKSLLAEKKATTTYGEAFFTILNAPQNTYRKNIHSGIGNTAAFSAQDNGGRRVRVWCNVGRVVTLA